MEPKEDDNKLDANSKTDENSPSELETLLNKLRKRGITVILNMDKKAQIIVSNWANDLVNQYSAILKNNPMKLKNIADLSCSKMDVKLAIKILLLVSVEKVQENNTVFKLRDKFVSLGSFQSIDEKDTIKLIKYTRDIQNKSMETETSPFPELNKYMDLILSEQKALLEEINGFIEDIRKIKKNL